MALTIVAILTTGHAPANLHHPVSFRAAAITVFHRHRVIGTGRGKLTVHVRPAVYREETRATNAPGDPPCGRNGDVAVTGDQRHVTAYVICSLDNEHLDEAARRRPASA